MFSTLVEDDLRAVVMGSNRLLLVCFGGLVAPLERELERRAAHRTGHSRPAADPAYALRMDATNFALANHDGGGGDHGRADAVLVGVSRSGKRPTCLCLALQYGVFPANDPLTEEELEGGVLPRALEAHRRKLFGLAIKPERLRQIRKERRPESVYASARPVQHEVRTAEAIFARYGITVLDTTDSSVEEIASRILNEAGVVRRLRPQKRANGP